MEQQITRQETILVTAATVAGELNGLNQVTQRMTLSVMNAKSISHRAGDAARGFQPITDHIEVIAKDISQFLGQISGEATTLSRLAVSYNQSKGRLKRFREVLKQVTDEVSTSAVRSVVEKLSAESEGYRTFFLKKLTGLNFLLEEMKKITRSSKVVSTISRVEAAYADEFRKDLVVVANNLEASTEYIQDRLNRSRSQLTIVMDLLRQERIQ